MLLSLMRSSVTDMNEDAMASLRAVHRHVGEVRILGSVARADGTPSPHKPHGESDADYAAARDWYDDLRGLITP